jgi:hypothetical protein
VITDNVEVKQETMVSNGKAVSRERISGCLKKANKLLSVVSKHKGTSPTFKMVAMIMKLRMDVETQFFCVEDNLDSFLGHDGEFRADIIALYKTTGAVVDKALSKSKGFLGRLSDVDGVFHHSKTSCFGLAGRILDFIGRNGGAAVSPAQIRKVEQMRHTDRFYVEMFQNHGFKKWISLKIMLL